MLTLDTIKEADVNKVVNAKSFRKGRGYLKRISSPTRRGQKLMAWVQGTSRYSVEIEVIEGMILATCSCAYSWGGYCKHIAAVLLQWIGSPGSFTIEMAAPTAVSDFPIETFPVDPPPTTMPKEMPAWLRQSFEARLAQDRKQFENWLGQYRVQDLRGIAAKQGWQISGTRKDDILNQIVQKALQPGIALQSVIGLDDEHRQVLQALAVLSREISYRVEQVEKLARLWGPLKQFKKVNTYTDHLCDAALAVPGTFDHQFAYALDFVPRSLIRILPPLLEERVQEAALSNQTAGDLRLADPYNFVQVANQLMLFLEQGSPPLRQPMPRPALEKYYEFLKGWDYVPMEIKEAGQANKFKQYDPNFSLTVPPPAIPLTDETVAKLAPIAGDADRLSFVYHLLVTAGLLLPGSPVTVWGQIKEQFLRQDESRQWATLVRTYFEMANWSELWLVLQERPDVQLKRGYQMYYYAGRFLPQHLYESLAVFRRQVLQLLACLPDDRWISLRALTELIHPVWEWFDARTRGQTLYGSNLNPTWYLAQGNTLLDTGDNKANWNIAQGNFIRHMLQGPLHWLGLVDLNISYGQLVAFRLHGLADLFWDRVESVPLPGHTLVESKPTAPKTAVSITDTVITVDPTTISAQSHNYLDNIAILKEAATSHFVYHLSGPAVHAAFEEGKSLQNILEGWEKWLPVPMPDTIHSRLAAWWKSYGQVRLYENVTVIEFGDEYALAEMKAATSLEKQVIAEISPRLVLIPEKAVDTLVAELEKAGYTPKQTDNVE